MEVVSRIEQMQRSIGEFDLSRRTLNCLRGENITQIGELCSMTEAELLRIPNFGRKALNEVKAVLESLHLGLSAGHHVVDPRSGFAVACIISFSGSARLEANLRAAAADKGWSIEKEAEYRVMRSFDTTAERAELRRIIREELITQATADPSAMRKIVVDVASRSVEPMMLDDIDVSRLYC